jgi:hypothetical protein
MELLMAKKYIGVKRDEKSLMPSMKRASLRPVRTTTENNPDIYSKKLREYSGAFLFKKSKNYQPPEKRNSRLSFVNSTLLQNRLIIGLITMVLLFTFKINAQYNVTLDFANPPTAYSIQINLKSNLKPKTLYHFLFDASAINKTNAISDSIEIHPIDSVTYEIIARFQNFNWKGYAVYTKKGFYNNDSISIVLKKIITNKPDFPKPVSADISFKIINEITSSKIIYNQNVRFNKKLSWFERSIIKWQIERYASRLSKDIANLEHP